MENLETNHLILKKLSNTDEAQRCHNNFWSSSETAKYMLWRPTSSVEESQKKMAKWIEYQENAYLWFIFEKESNEPIGFFSFEKLSDSKIGAIGLCFGEKYVGKGYGYELMTYMLEYLKKIGVNEIEYSHLSGNIPSQKLADKLGFKYTHQRKIIRPYDSKEFNEIFYVLKF